MGMHIKTYLNTTMFRAGIALTITWMLSGGVGITTDIFDREEVPERGQLAGSATGQNWNEARTIASPGTMLWSELTPTAAAAWESWTRASTAMGTVMTNIRFSFIGTLPASEGPGKLFRSAHLQCGFFELSISAHRDLSD